MTVSEWEPWDLWQEWQPAEDPKENQSLSYSLSTCRLFTQHTLTATGSVLSHRETEGRSQPISESSPHPDTHPLELHSEGLTTKGKVQVPWSPLKKGQPGPIPDPRGFQNFLQLKEGVLPTQLQPSPNQRSGLWKSPVLWWGQVWAHGFTHR